MHIISALGRLRDGNYHKFKASLDYRMNLFQKERRGKKEEGRKGGREGRKGERKRKRMCLVWLFRNPRCNWKFCSFRIKEWTRKTAVSFNQVLVSVNLSHSNGYWKLTLGRQMWMCSWDSRQKACQSRQREPCPPNIWDLYSDHCLLLQTKEAKTQKPWPSCCNSFLF